MMDLEKVLIREINNDSCIFLYKEGDCWSVYDNFVWYFCFLYFQFNVYDCIYQVYEIVLKCVMLSNVMIEKFIEYILVSMVYEDEIEICILKEKRVELESWCSMFGL